MSTLIDRLTEVMTAKGWSQSDLVRVSGQSHSVVSQWLGKGSKLIKSIGKMQAAEAIEAASGYSALWVATGAGPKFAATKATPTTIESALGSYAIKQPTSIDDALERIGLELARDLSDFTRADLADEMAKWVHRKGAEHSRRRVAKLLEADGAATGTRGKPS